jgi:hypothetical protein
MRGMTFFGLLALGVFGLIIGDFLTHPAATSTAGSQVISLEKNTGNQLLGVSA